MDASRFITMKNAAAVTEDDRRGCRTRLAEALRDMADEIEKGERLVIEVQTQEAVEGPNSTGSIMFMRTVLKK